MRPTIKRKRVIMGRLTSLKDQDRSFDLNFWERVGAAGKFEAAWQMVEDLVNWNPRYAGKLRLRRTVAALKSRPR